MGDRRASIKLVPQTNLGTELHSQSVGFQDKLVPVAIEFVPDLSIQLAHMDEPLDLSPSQFGIELITGPVGVSVLPQLSVTVGSVGATISAAQATVLPSLGGIVKSARSMVKV